MGHIRCSKHSKGSHGAKRNGAFGALTVASAVPVMTSLVPPTKLIVVSVFALRVRDPVTDPATPARRSRHSAPLARRQRSSATVQRWFVAIVLFQPCLVLKFGNF